MGGRERIKAEPFMRDRRDRDTEYYLWVLIGRVLAFVGSS